jgi:O-antigen/teichoic acid export membrane protein
VLVLGGQSVATALGVFELWFQARIASRAVVITRTALTLAFQAARCVLIGVGASLGAFALLTVAHSAATAVGVAVLFLVFRSPASRLIFDRRKALDLIRDSWPLVIVSVSIVVYMKIDQVMLAAMSGDRENGIYATAAALSELWYFLPMAIASTVFPLIVKAHDEMGSAEFETRMQAFYDGMAALGYLVAVPIMIGAEPLIRALYGDAYGRSAVVLRIHVASFVFVCLGVARGRYLTARNLMRFWMLTALLGAGINVAANLVLIPRAGAVGAAWSTLIAYAAANYLSSALDARVRRQITLATRALFVIFRPKTLRDLIAARTAQ